METNRISNNSRTTKCGPATKQHCTVMKMNMDESQKYKLGESKKAAKKNA